MHQAYDGVHFILKKHLKLSQKIDFLAHFERFFGGFGPFLLQMWHKFAEILTKGMSYIR